MNWRPQSKSCYKTEERNNTKIFPTLSKGSLPLSVGPATTTFSTTENHSTAKSASQGHLG